MIDCEPLHERARRDSEVFATFTPIGSMTFEGKELRLANCACGSTIGKYLDNEPKPAPVPVSSSTPPRPSLCPHCGELALEGEITCGRVGCREHGSTP